MLAMPGLTPGRGEGITASIRDRAMARAARRAMRWSSRVGVSSITEGVIGLLRAGELDAHLVGQADGGFPRAADPALLYAVLAGAGVFGYTGPLLVDFHQGLPQ